MADEKGKKATKTAAEGSASTATENTNPQGEQASTQGNEGAPAASGDAKPKTGKGSRKGQPIPIGPRRLLGLALRGLMAEIENGSAKAPSGEGETAVAGSPGFVAAQEALAKNKYSDLRPQAERLAEVQEKLQAAIAAGDGTAISKLGKELNRIKAGL